MSPSPSPCDVAVVCNPTITFLYIYLFKSLLPPTPWKPAAAAINATISKLIKPKLTNAIERQVLFEVLGPAFVKAQCPDSEDNPLLLLPPLMKPVQRTRHVKQIKDWLNRTVGPAVHAAKLLKSKELRAFDKHSKKIANAGEYHIPSLARSLHFHLYISIHSNGGGGGEVLLTFHLRVLVFLVFVLSLFSPV